MLVLISKKKQRVWWTVLDKCSIFIDRYPSSSILLRLLENLDYMHIMVKKLEKKENCNKHWNQNERR